MFLEHPLTCQPLETDWRKGASCSAPSRRALRETAEGRAAAGCIGGVFWRQLAVLSTVHEWGGAVPGGGPEQLTMPFAEEEKPGKGAFGGRRREK